MIRRARRVEDGAAIEERQDLLPSHTHISLPKLKVPAIFLFPVFVQIDQNVDPAIEFKLRMPVKVRMHGKFASWLDLVQAAPSIIGVGSQALDPGQRFQKPKHGPAIQKIKNIAVSSGQIFHQVKG